LDSEPVGVLRVVAAPPARLDEAAAETLGLLSGVIAAHIGHAIRYSESQRRGLQDPLTGLWNRGAFDRRLQEEVARRHRYGRVVSVLLLDLDHFKAVNDTRGHPAGDAVLRSIAGCLQSVRGSDAAFRVG